MRIFHEHKIKDILQPSEETNEAAAKEDKTGKA